MSHEQQWMMKLPVAAPERKRVPSESATRQDQRLNNEMTAAVNKMSSWLGFDYAAEMTIRDVAALKAALAPLRDTACQNESLWTAVPDASFIPHAESLVSSFRDACVLERQRREASSKFIETVGVTKGSSVSGSLGEAAIMQDRYENALGEIALISRLLRQTLGVPNPTLEDAVFLAGVLPSLRSADARALDLAVPTGSDLSLIAASRAKMTEISDRMKQDFAFEPILHGADALGGIRRAFATRHAPDFLAAARKLGAVVNDAGQAKMAASLMLEYIQADDEITSIALRLRSTYSPESASLGRIKEALVERSRLMQSIERRRSVIVLNESNLSEGLALLGQGYIDPILFETDAGMNSDTRKLLEDNIAGVGGGELLADFIANLTLVLGGLSEWIEDTNKNLGLSSFEDMSHADFDAYLQEHPALVSCPTIGYHIYSNEQADEIVRHVAWLREAAMLPLSDEKLAAYLAVRGKDNL